MLQENPERVNVRTPHSFCTHYNDVCPDSLSELSFGCSEPILWKFLWAQMFIIEPIQNVFVASQCCADAVSQGYGIREVRIFSTERCWGL